MWPSEVEKQRLTRRRVLKYGLAGTTALLLYGCFAKASLLVPTTKEQSQLLLDALLPLVPGGELSRRLAGDYIKQNPSQLMDIIRALTENWSEYDWLRSGNPRWLKDHLGSQIRSDYLGQRIFISDNIIFSRTEAQLASIVSHIESKV